MAAINKLLLSLSFLSLSLLSTTTTTVYGVVSSHRKAQYLESESLCKQTYGFMPCSTSALGNLFLIIVYGYLIFMASKYLCKGGRQLEILGPGVLGKIVLPKLDALPSAILILMSGLSGTKETAQSQVSVGMGLLAGSTVMLITIIWGTCVIVGKCDIEGPVAKDGQNKKGFSLTETGVSTDIWTCYAARIMAISVIPFIVIQVPQILNSTLGRHAAVLISLIVSVLMVIAYCLFQVSQPWIQRQRRLAYARHRHVISGISKHQRQLALGKLLNDRGEPNKDVIKKLFYWLDENKDGRLSASELKALIIGIRFDEMNLDLDDAVDRLLKDLETSQDSQIDLDEFVKGIAKWLDEESRGNRSADPGSQKAKLLSDFREQTKWEHHLLGADDQSDEVIEAVENPKWTSVKAVSMLLIGFATIMAAAFSRPLVDAVANFSVATGTPSFFISFIALPLATKFSEVAPLLIYANRKKIRATSLAFTELYRTISTNNVICLSVFLTLLYIRGLKWDFSSEVLAIVIVCGVMSGFASFRTTFPLWTCLLAYILCPFYLALVYVLRYVFGWA